MRYLNQTAPSCLNRSLHHPRRLFELDPAHADAIESDLMKFGDERGYDVAVDFAIEGETK